MIVHQTFTRNIAAGMASTLVRNSFQIFFGFGEVKKRET